ncbi:hypothetical protein F5Y14DRAFT_454063 [Nemania sp. NC0429]|nr:hypothetical protein F5Y14DRAFT_454063 [Nemania sp. NC0429]
MSGLLSLPRASRQIVESFVHRSEFWFRMPESKRDYFWTMNSPGKPYSYTAVDVVQFTKANCLAATTARNDKLLGEFKSKLQADWASSRATPPDGMRLVHLMHDYLAWIDRVFFFGLITHPTKLGDRLVTSKSLIKLSFRDGLNDEGNALNGAFAYYTGTLWISTVNSSGEFHSFDTILCSFIHELVHVYLHVLSWDQSAASCWRNVYQDHGHGVQFYELLHFILARIFEWMPMMTPLGDLMKETEENLRAALAKPSVSDADARMLIDEEVRLTFG